MTGGGALSCPVVYMHLFSIMALVILTDQITKVAVRVFMTEGQSISVIDGFLSISYYNNSGVAFSFLEGHRMVVTILQVAALVAVAVLLYKTSGRRKLYDISLAIIFAGGLGNIIDRIIFGKVTDMISFSIFPPVFNVADIGVTVGCAILLVDIFKEMWDEKGKSGAD